MSSSSSAAGAASRASLLARPISQNPLWADVAPVKPDDGEPQGQMPVVPINYPAHYSDVMDIFRGVLRSNELSERTLLLSEAAIDCNSANYTAWHFRRLCLAKLQSDLRAELDWVATVALDSPKNYQLWHHRRCVLTNLGDLSSSMADVELELTKEVLEMDGKNYHAWTHRQWCLKFFTSSLPVLAATAAAPAVAASATPAASASQPNADLVERELAYVDSLLQADVRNNSAWNQRFFVRTLVLGGGAPAAEVADAAAALIPAPASFTVGMSSAVISAELLYAGGKLLQAVHNESPWNYLEGLMKQREFGDEHHRMLRDMLLHLPGCPEEAAGASNGDDAEYARLAAFANRFAQSLLVELWDACSQPEHAARAAQWLASELDPVRTKYWTFRAQQFKAVSPPAATAQAQQ